MAVLSTRDRTVAATTGCASRSRPGTKGTMPRDATNATATSTALPTPRTFTTPAPTRWRFTRGRLQTRRSPYSATRTDPTLARPATMWNSAPSMPNQRHLRLPTGAPHAIPRRGARWRRSGTDKPARKATATQGLQTTRCMARWERTTLPEDHASRLAVTSPTRRRSIWSRVGRDASHAMDQGSRQRLRVVPAMQALMQPRTMAPRRTSARLATAQAIS